MEYLAGKEITFPLCQKGKLPGVISDSSPFSTGGPRGILLRARIPEDHRSILTLQAKLNYTTSTAGGFCKY
jgi:hypothetical protein